jgi:hypothetical protein
MCTQVQGMDASAVRGSSADSCAIKCNRPLTRITACIEHASDATEQGTNSKLHQHTQQAQLH